MKQHLIIMVAVSLCGCASQDLPDIFRRGTDAPPKVESAAEPESKPETMDETAPEEPVAAKPEPQPRPASPRAPQLVAGIEAYDNGKHREAAKILRGALSTRLNRADQVEAHKYLAFIECSLGRKSQCRDEFRNALKIDPSFDLGPAEAGHPLWGPVFRSVKQSPRR